MSDPPKSRIIKKGAIKVSWLICFKDGEIANDVKHRDKLDGSSGGVLHGCCVIARYPQS